MVVADTQPYGDRDSVGFKALELAVRSLSAYHRHEVFGLEHVPTLGPALIVCNHSLATYDTMLLAPHFADELGRELLAMVDRRALTTPFVRAIFQQIATLGTRDNARKVLREGRLLLVMPGGMRESLRDVRQRYQIDWRKRYGFIRVSMAAGAPIVLAACPRADDIFHVYANRVTPLMYERFKLPMPLFRGVGPTLIPRPVKLTHLLSEPLHPDVAPDRVTDRDVEAHHQRVVARMCTLMAQALDAGGE